MTPTRTRPPLAVFALAATVVLALAGCGTPATSSTGGDRQLVIARAMDMSTLDPHTGYCDTCMMVYGALYDTLVTADPADPSIPRPELAESWDVSEDLTQFTFHLDPDAVFSDGSPVESNDVKFSLERLTNLAGSASFLTAGMSGIETPDTSTVIVTFDAPNSAFLSILGAVYLSIVNEEVVVAAGGDSSTDAATVDSASEWFLENSAGSGPYVVASYQPGTALEFAANENYWKEAPEFPSIVIKEVAEASSQLQQVQQGDADIALQISSDSLGQLEGDVQLTTTVEDSYNFVYVLLQGGATGGEPLSDARVRQAIRAAIDYDKVIDATVAGNGQVLGAPVPNGFPGTEDAPLPEYDLEAARALLAEAGYPDGFSLTAAYPKFNVYGVDFDVMMQSIQQDLVEVGITLTLESLDYTQWAERLRSDDGIAMSAVYFAPDYFDTSGFVTYFGMVPGSPWSPRAIIDGPFINDIEVSLLSEALTLTGDAQADAYAKIVQAMYDDAIALPIVNPQTVLVFASDLTGVGYTPNVGLDLAGIGLAE